MPWTARDAKRFNSGADTKEKRSVWAHVANQTLRDTGDEGRAVRYANHAVSQMKKAELVKNLYVVNNLVGAFQDIRVAQRELLLEAGDESDSDDRRFAERLAVIARDLSGVIGDKARHEGREAVELTDVDDAVLSGLLKSLWQMQLL